MIKKYNYINLKTNNYELNGKNVIIWGISESALALYVSLNSRGICVKGFTDSFVKEKGKTFANLPVYTFTELGEMKNIVIYISTTNNRYQRQILEMTNALQNTVILCEGVVWGAGEYDIEKLREMEKSDKDEIEFVINKLKDEKSKQTFYNLLKYRVTNDPCLIYEIYENGHKQYFPNSDILKKSDNEVFIDAGAYNGETSYEFTRWVEDSYDKIYMMEPDPFMVTICKEYVSMKKMKKVQIMNCATYSCCTEVDFFDDYSTGSSCIVGGKGSSKVKTMSIDEMLDGARASFIKMDIEGVEMEALKGCEKTIEKYKPKLAISIYHKENDLWKIPFMLMKKYPFYKYYIRHYTDITTETVLYASI